MKHFLLGQEGIRLTSGFSFVPHRHSNTGSYLSRCQVLSPDNPTQNVTPRWVFPGLMFMTYPNTLFFYGMDGHSNSGLFKGESCTGNLEEGIFACKTYATASNV